ncbi:MAG: hypothetical protein M1536_01450 [Firmicutes bacterium]|nr:hypothetical protein [Bacillota bacterium]
MKKTFILIFTIAIIALLFQGCMSPKLYQIGIVDTDRVLQEIGTVPKYQKYNEEYVKERNELASKLPKTQQELTEQHKKEIIEFRQKWSGKNLELKADIIKAGEAVKGTKKLDIIIVNPSMMPIVEYGGIDVTSEVIQGLKAMK